MLRVTSDTNIYISGFAFGGLLRDFLEFARTGMFRLDISEAIKQEVLRVLRDKFKYSSEALRVVDGKRRDITRHVTPAQTLDVIKTDPSDNRILECAVAAKSGFIVSGDARHLLPVGGYEGIRIVTVANFLELLQQSRLEWLLAGVCKVGLSPEKFPKSSHGFSITRLVGNSP